MPTEKAAPVSRRKLGIFAVLAGAAAVLVVVNGIRAREDSDVKLREWTDDQAIPTVAVVQPDAKALKDMVRDARDRLQDGRQVIIFPEGTRKAPGAAPDYKPGVAAIYRELELPCIPMATNSGVHWPAHGFPSGPGTIVFEFLPAIPAGLKRAEFMRELQDRIETASNALLAEGL